MPEPDDLPPPRPAPTPPPSTASGPARPVDLPKPTRPAPPPVPVHRASEPEPEPEPDLDRRSTFDPVRAALYLVAFVIGIYGLIIVASVAACLVYMETIITRPEIVCDPKNRLSELLSAALAAALAFAGGFSRRR